MTTETQLEDIEREILDSAYDSDEAAYEQYRSVSKAAVFSLVLAVFALTGLVFPLLLTAALLAVILGLLALRNLRRYPDELTGKTSAVLGVVAGILLLIGGSTMHTYIYMTEVPAGYERISFSDLDWETGPMGLPKLPVNLDGKRVFVKGYVHPSVSDMGEIKRFVLVPDMGTCCFGGQPALSDMIEVKITGKHGLRYAPRKRKLAGTFHVSYRLRKVVGGLEGGYYALDADYVK
jgi:hypothetical protein